MKPCPLCCSSDTRKDRILNSYQLLSCNNCHFVFADIAADEIEAVNSSLEDDFAAYFSENHQSSFEAVFFRNIAKHYTDRLGPGTVLDVGCGNGLLLSYFKEFGWQCSGIDLSPWSRNYARRYGFDFCHGRLEDQRFAPGTFNLITSTSTLEHVAQPKEHVASMLSAVKPSGRIYFSGIPNYRAIALRWGLADFGANTPPHHPNFFSPESLGRFFRSFDNDIASFNIRTYGISGANRAYSRLKKCLATHETGTKTDVRKTETIRTDRQEIAVRPALTARHRLGALLYRMAGRPLGIGSKIEVEVVRK